MRKKDKTIDLISQKLMLMKGLSPSLNITN